LALAGLQAQRAAGGPLPHHTVLFSPWVDASLSAPDLDDTVDALLSIEGLRGCAALYAGDVSLDDPRVSPLFGPLADLPPIEIHAGTRDLMAVDAQRLHDALTAAGGTSTVHIHADMPHDFVLFPSRETTQVLAQMAQSLAVR
jgi:acetyl esterase/lipase